MLTAFVRKVVWLAAWITYFLAEFSDPTRLQCDMCKKVIFSSPITKDCCLNMNRISRHLSSMWQKLQAMIKFQCLVIINYFDVNTLPSDSHGLMYTLIVVFLHAICPEDKSKRLIVNMTLFGFLPGILNFSIIWLFLLFWLIQVPKIMKIFAQKLSGNRNHDSADSNSFVNINRLIETIWRQDRMSTGSQGHYQILKRCITKTRLTSFLMSRLVRFDLGYECPIRLTGLQISSENDQVQVKTGCNRFYPHQKICC